MTKRQAETKLAVFLFGFQRAVDGIVTVPFLLKR